MSDHASFMLAMFEAVDRDQSSMSQQQIVDSVTTVNDVKLETNIYDYWNVTPSSAQTPSWNNVGYGAGQLGAIADLIRQASAGYHNDPSNPQWQTFISDATNQYQVAATQAQNSESQEDGSVQSAQNQASADGTNLQMKAQLAQSLLSIQTTTSNLLGRLV